MRDFIDTFSVTITVCSLLFITFIFWLAIDARDEDRAAELCRIKCAEEKSTALYKYDRVDNTVQCVCLEKSDVYIIQRD